MLRNTVGDAVKDLQVKLGLDPEFFHKILMEDDWTFIIKVHALMEAAVTYSICSKLGEDSLNEILSHTELGNKRCGKIAFAKALNLLEKEDRSFLSILSELRNQLIHNVENVNFDLLHYIANMNSNKFRSFVKSCDNFSSPVQGSDKRMVRDNGNILIIQELIKNNPKKAIWNASLSVLFTIYAKKLIHEHNS